MKGLICYFSTTGNTLLACKYIAKHIKSLNFELYDITKDSMPDLKPYKVIGFATFVASLGPPALIRDFIKQLPQQKQKYAFVFTTYANCSGRTLKTMQNLLAAKGFVLIAGHALHTPENYPPYIKKRIIHANAPNSKELERFNLFINNMDLGLINLTNGKSIPEATLQVGWFSNLMPILPLKRASKKMGSKFIDYDLCTECGICKKHCPYKAIELNPKPIFNTKKCYGCWSCYNHCPNQAIYTKKLKRVGQYPKPNQFIQDKLNN
jgi:ferredoxin/flavodoxin